MSDPTVDPSLRDTAADPRIQSMQGVQVRKLCCAMLGKWPATGAGYQFQDTNGNARCAFNAPCDIHDEETKTMSDQPTERRCHAVAEHPERGPVRCEFPEGHAARHRAGFDDGSSFIWGDDLPSITDPSTPETEIDEFLTEYMRNGWPADRKPTRSEAALFELCRRALGKGKDVDDGGESSRDDRLSAKPAYRDFMDSYNPLEATPIESAVYELCRRALGRRP